MGQNNLDELWSLLNFLMGEIFDDLRVFRSWFDAKDIHHNDDESDRILQQEQQKNILSTLHQILTPFLLRRVKADVDLKIPPKKEVLVYCPLTEKQKEMYEYTVTRTINQLVGTKKKEEVELIKLKNGKFTHTGDLGAEKKPRNATLNNDYSIFMDNGVESDRTFNKYCDKMRIIQEKQEAKEREALSCSAYTENERREAEVHYSLKSRLMDMRKTCNHPYLIEYPLSEDGNFYRADEEMVDICGKLKVLDQMLDELAKRGHKTLIFSQMTRLLDILGDYLHYREKKFSRLDGSMHFEDRQQNIDRFNEHPDYKIFLLSTRAGGLGINLTSADTVIIYDSDWNPQQDLQAQDRAHRIGQTKPVMIYRLVTANTIDQKIVERAAAKRKLEKMIIHKSKFKAGAENVKSSLQSISAQELLILLDSKDYIGSMVADDKYNGQVFSEEQLNKLLDRSDITWGLEEAKKPVKKTNSSSGVKGVFQVIDCEEKNPDLGSVKD